MMNVRSQRGSGLLLAIVVVLVITVIAVAVVRFSARELSGSYAGRRADALTACAEAGRQMLMSRFRAMGLKPTSLETLDVTLDDASGKTTSVFGGHYDDVRIQQVVALPAGSMGPSPFAMQDRSNTIRATGGGDLGGTPYKVIVRCAEGASGEPGDSVGNRQLEIEFAVRFGL
jgi:type II secretory pathway pseudopilin PulG